MLISTSEEICHRTTELDDGPLIRMKLTEVSKAFVPRKCLELQKINKN